MPTFIRGAVLYSAAELGLDGVNVPAAGGVVVGNVVPWLGIAALDSFALIWDAGATGATPLDVFHAQFGFGGQALPDSAQSALVQGATNNPRVQRAVGSMWSNLAGNGAATTGIMIPGEVAKCLASGYWRPSVRNNHATIAMTFTLINAIGYSRALA